MKSISIMQLTPGRCACIVPEEPWPRYCGAEVADNPYRMCETHAAAYINKVKSNAKALQHDKDGATARKARVSKFVKGRA